MNAGVCGGKRCGCNAPLFTGYPFTSAYNKMKEALLDQALLKEVALQVVQQGLLSNWRFYAALLALSLISGAAGAFLSKYFGKRAETAAVDADLKKILRQVEKTTEVAEQVRSKVDHADWVVREWKTIRRTKLEELVQSAISVRQWLNQYKFGWLVVTDHDYMEKQEMRNLPCPAIHVNMLTVLYFTELEEQSRELLQASRAIDHHLQNISKKARNDGKHSSGQRRAIFDAALPEFNKHHHLLIHAIEELKDKAAEIMRKERDGMIATNKED